MMQIRHKDLIDDQGRLSRKFPGGPLVRTQASIARGMNLIPGWERKLKSSKPRGEAKKITIKTSRLS